jgi:hypothetical protein
MCGRADGVPEGQDTRRALRNLGAAAFLGKVKHEIKEREMQVD